MGAEASVGAIVRARGGELLEKFPVNAAQQGDARHGRLPLGRPRRSSRQL